MPSKSPRISGDSVQKEFRNGACQESSQSRSAILSESSPTRASPSDDAKRPRSSRNADLCPSQPVGFWEKLDQLLITKSTPFSQVASNEEAKEITGDSVSNLLIEQLRAQLCQINQLKAKSVIDQSDHKKSIDDLQKTYECELVHLQNLLSTMPESVKDFQKFDESADAPTQVIELHKEVKIQENLIRAFQKENEKLFQENKDLKQRLQMAPTRSSKVPQTTERLVQENAILHIELNQLKDELKTVRLLRNASESHEPYAKYEKEIAFLKDELEESKERLIKQGQVNSLMSEDLKSTQIQLKELQTECEHLSQKLVNAAPETEERRPRQETEHTDEVSGVSHVGNGMFLKEQALTGKRQKLERTRLKCGRTVIAKRSISGKKDLPLSTKLAYETRIGELLVQLDQMKLVGKLATRSMEEKFEALKMKYDEHVVMLEGQIAALQDACEASTNKLADSNTKQNSVIPDPASDSNADYKAGKMTDGAELQGQITVLRKELARRQNLIGHCDKASPLREEAETVAKANWNLCPVKPRRRLASSRSPPQKFSTQEQLPTCNNTKAEFGSSPICMARKYRNVEVQTNPLEETGIILECEEKVREMECRNQSLTEQIVSVKAALRSSEMQVRDLQTQFQSRTTMIQKLNSKLANERLKHLKSVINCGLSDDEPSGRSVYGVEPIMKLGMSTARLRCELNVTRQRADRLQMQLETLRRLHMATVTGKPPKEAIDRLFDQLATLEKQQEMKNRHLEEYIQCRLLEAHATRECPCASDTTVAVSAATHWRRIAERRAGDLARLGQEMDKLMALLAEVSAIHEVKLQPAVSVPNFFVHKAQT